MSGASAWRSHIASIVVAIFSGAGLPAAETAATPPARWNILFLLADDQRADTIAALGNAHIATPNLDRLVREGTAFTRAYCMGSMQGAVCVPSRGMILTGRTLFHVRDDLTGQDTWPEALRRQGYSTFLTGKWHNQVASAVRVFDTGKAIFLGGMGNPFALPLVDISGKHTLVNERVNREHSVAQFANAASEFLRAQTAATPFLCYVAFNLPHDPRVAPFGVSPPLRCRTAAAAAQLSAATRLQQWCADHSRRGPGYLAA